MSDGKTAPGLVGGDDGAGPVEHHDLSEKGIPLPWDTRASLPPPVPADLPRPGSLGRGILRGANARQGGAT